MPSSMRADGMYNFMTDAHIHRGTQGHFNIHRQKNTTTYPRKEMHTQLLTGKRRQLQMKYVKCLFTDIHIYTNMCLSFNTNISSYLETQHPMDINMRL